MREDICHNDPPPSMQIYGEKRHVYSSASQAPTNAPIASRSKGRSVLIDAIT